MSHPVNDNIKEQVYEILIERGYEEGQAAVMTEYVFERLTDSGSFYNQVDAILREYNDELNDWKTKPNHQISGSNGQY